MTLPFKETFKLTQVWGNKLIINGVDIYAKFGLSGHNGIDWGMPSGTPIYAPHDGSVIERAYDAGGYGQYIKIENNEEGSILAHLQKKYIVNVWQKVKEGELIGYSDNTGNSTGPHLHWGYYLLPRNRNNGYSGTINQLPLLKGENMIDEEMIIKQKTFEKLVTKSTKYDEFVKLGYNSPEELKNIIAGMKARATDMESKAGEWEAECKNRQEQVGRLKDQLLEQSRLYKALSSKLKSSGDLSSATIGLLESRISALQKQVNTISAEKGDLNKKIAMLKIKQEYEVIIKIFNLALVKF